MPPIQPSEVTVVIYGGMTYWSVTDPVLVLDAAGTGQLTGTASGFGASMTDTSQWMPLEERSIVLADIRGASIRSPGGFSVVPQYLGVAAATGLGQRALTPDNASFWGAFPASFLEFQRNTGQLGYWMTTGGLRDPAKPPTALYISYDAEAPIVAPVPESPAGTPVANTPINTRPPALPGSPATTADPADPAGIAGAPLTFTPERDGLVPATLAAALPAVAVPLLDTALALLASILAVLNMMGVLPWQQARLRP